MTKRAKVSELPGVMLNGQQLDKVYMRFVDGTHPGSTSSLGFPQSRIALRRDDTGFTLAIPPVLAVQLFAAGVVPPLPDPYVDLFDGTDLHRGLVLVWVRCCKRPDGREDIALRFEPASAESQRSGDAPALPPRRPPRLRGEQ